MQQRIGFIAGSTSWVIIHDDAGDTVEIPFDMLQQFVFEQTELTKKLQDPEAVHVNMLSGRIAKISMRQCAHVHGQDMVERWNKFEQSKS